MFPFSWNKCAQNQPKSKPTMVCLRELWIRYQGIQRVFPLLHLLLENSDGRPRNRCRSGKRAQGRWIRPNPMQENVFGDMNFGTSKMSEDCLYLNIWTPAKTMDERRRYLSISMVADWWQVAGEPRYTGLSLARRGIVAITANYREGIFGYFAHPQLSKETRL